MTETEGTLQFTKGQTTKWGTRKNVLTSVSE